jgi:hypothetical protein
VLEARFLEIFEKWAAKRESANDQIASLKKAMAKSDRKLTKLTSIIIRMDRVPVDKQV